MIQDQDFRFKIKTLDRRNHKKFRIMGSLRFLDKDADLCGYLVCYRKTNHDIVCHSYLILHLFHAFYLFRSI